VIDPAAAPEVTQHRVEGILASLHTLCAFIREARAALAPLETALAGAWHEFDQRVGHLRRERLRIEYEIEILRAPAESETAVGVEEAKDRMNDGTATPLADPDAVEKDVLLEHLVRVLDPDTDQHASMLLATVQGLCNDPDATLADLLEEMPWGPAWTARARNEGLSAQHRRLAVWERALRSQLGALNNIHEQLSKRDPRYSLYLERQRGPESWEAYLNRAAARQQEHNQELRAELEELRHGPPDTGKAV